MSGWSALLGAFGGVALFFGLLVALLAAFQPVPDIAIWGNLLIGVVLLGVAIALNFEAMRDRMGSGEARRASRYGSSAILSTILGLVILGLIGFMSTRYTQRFDWTEERVHSLTDQTGKVVAGLERDVKITAFFGELDAPPIRDLLRRYTYASEQIVLEFADPNIRPDLVATYAVDEADLQGGLVRIAMGDDAVELKEFSEEKITNALVQLSRSGERKVYFLAGHNEREIEGEGAAGKEGFDQAADSLRNENYVVEPLVIAQVGSVPDDADAVVIAGPTRGLPPEELDALRRYLDDGGGVLLLVDPRARTNVDTLADAFGVEIGEDIIVDLQLAFFQQYMSPFAGAYAGDHPITEPMGEQSDPTLFHVARSVDAREDGGEATAQPIVFTGEKSWAERDLDELTASGRFAYDDDDRIGPVPVAVAAEKSNGEAETEPDADSDGATGGRLVVIGDSDFATNEFLARYGGNRDLFVNSVNWLLGDVEAISVRPHQSRASRFVGSEEEVRAIQYLSVFVLPEAIAVLGVWAWWSRRKAPGR